MVNRGSWRKGGGEGNSNLFVLEIVLVFQTLIIASHLKAVEPTLIVTALYTKGGLIGRNPLSV